MIRTYKDPGPFERGIEMIKRCEDKERLTQMRLVLMMVDTSHINRYKQATLIKMIDDKLLAMHEF